MRAKVRLKRIYEPAADEDGRRVLVDRLWPRGVSKVDASIDLWLKDAAPSPALRKWFGHRPERFPEFRRRYREELSDNPAIPKLRELVTKYSTTLLYGAKDEAHNHAIVLAEYLATLGASASVDTDPQR
jgi:DNA-3-methyladenine glycosylase